MTMRDPRRRWTRGLAAALAGALLISPLATSSATAQEASSVNRLVLTATTDPTTSQHVTWRTPDAASDRLEFRPLGSSTAQEVTATLTDTIGNQRHFLATITGLAPGSAYEYRVGGDGDWTGWHTFRTAAAGAEPFEFIYFGDAQNQLRTVWPQVANAAAARAPDAAFTLHAGDLIDWANDQTEWTDWFNGLGSLATTKPVIATPGNHEYFGDNQLRNWQSHFEYPKNQPTLATIGDLADRAVGDSPAARQHAAYFEHFTQRAANTVYHVDYQGLRVISLDSERITAYLTPPDLPACSSGCPNAGNLWFEFQAAWLHHVLEHNPNDWTVVTFHRPVYSSASGRNETAVRNAFGPVLQQHDVDLVLNGHDHTYARGYHNDDATDTPGLTTGPVYAVGNSGGKWYTLSPAGNNVWTQNNATQVTRAANVSAFQVISVDGDTIEYRSYVAARNGNPPEQLGDLLDAFTITKNDLGKFITESGVEIPDGEPAPDEQRIEVTVPDVDVEPGEFVWSIDGGNKLVDLGVAAEHGDRFQASGAINPVRVTDTRLGAPAWSVAGQVGDFVADGQTVDGKYLGWAPAVTENAGGAVPGDPVASGFLGGDGLKESATLGSAPVGHTLGSSLLAADLELLLPLTVTNGTYRATLTLTALS